MIKEPTEIFLVTQYDPLPSYYHPAKKMQVMTKHALLCKLKCWKGSSMTFKILRAPVGEFEDVTNQFE